MFLFVNTHSLGMRIKGKGNNVSTDDAGTLCKETRKLEMETGYSTSDCGRRKINNVPTMT